MANILVTGFAGFLGSHLTIRHLGQGDTVFGIDNFCSSNKNSKHFGQMISHPNFNWVAGDIRNDDLVRQISGHREGFDIVYNFACPASPPIYQKMPIETLLTCTQGFNNIIKCTTKPNAKIIQASTSEVYGDALISPQNENYWGNVNSYGIRSNYDEGKRAAEALAHDYLKKYNVDIRVVRIFNTYGPHMDAKDGRVVTNFIKQILNHENITIFGSGEQTRSFCYVDDLIDGIFKMKNLTENPHTPINIGNPGEFTILELVTKLFELVPETKSKIVYNELPGDDPKQRKPDITLAKKMLQWEPTVDLTTGLSRMIFWAKQNNW